MNKNGPTEQQCGLNNMIFLVLKITQFSIPMSEDFCPLAQTHTGLFLVEKRLQFPRTTLPKERNFKIR
jgi:hypothetical protein